MTRGGVGGARLRLGRTLIDHIIDTFKTAPPHTHHAFRYSTFCRGALGAFTGVPCSRMSRRVS